jgi:1A family penicillin-binding protein
MYIAQEKGKAILTVILSGLKRLASLKPKRKKRKKGKASKKPFFYKKRVIISGIFLFLLLGFLSASILFIKDLPNPETLKTREIAQTTHIYDQHGTLLYQIYANQNRTIIPLSEIPDSLQKATLAIEDKNFYHHLGFDLPAIFRAFNSNLHGGDTQGASTITQQLIKSSFFTPEKSIIRKVKELILSFWTERLYSKQDILAMYFNQIPYGGTAWGVEAAAEVYFHKHAKNLTLAESAFLAGITSAPSAYSPYGSSPKLWKQRQAEVLKNMLTLGYITKQQQQQALNETLHFAPQATPLHAPHFVMYVKELLIKHYGLAAVERGGLRVYTTLDLPLQEKAQQTVTDEVANADYLNVTNGSALVTNPSNGDILAMVGSHDFNDPNGGNVNATMSLRQPGSSIKVVTYTAALEHGMTAATLIDDSPTVFPNPGNTPYSPVNYDGKFHGRVTLRTALGNSFNIPAVKTLQQVGIPTMVNLGKNMGITSWGDSSNYGLAITLGGAETTVMDMATVFGTLANEGDRVTLNPIKKVTNSNGDILEEKKDIIRIRVVDKSVSYIMSDILADNTARMMEFGPASPLVIPNHFVSVKTGTTDYKRDNWTIGYTPEFVVAVWVGNNNNEPMSQDLASGITGAAPIWHNIMQVLLDNRPDVKRSIPKNVVQKFCNGRLELFIIGTENAACQPSFQPRSDNFFTR